MVTSADKTHHGQCVHLCITPTLGTLVVLRSRAVVAGVVARAAGGNAGHALLPGIPSIVPWGAGHEALPIEDVVVLLTLCGSPGLSHTLAMVHCCRYC